MCVAISVSVYYNYPTDTSIHPRLRQSTKKKRKLNLHLKRPGARKDEMKLMLLKLKSFIHHEQTDSGGMVVLPGERDSDSDRGSVGSAAGQVNS